MLKALGNLLHGAAAVGRALTLSLLRPVYRLWLMMKLVFVHRRRGANIRFGTSVLLSKVDFIRCADKVTIGDHAELIATQPAQGKTASIVLGKSVKVSRRCQLASSPGSTIDIGDFSSLHNSTYILGNVRVGRYCLISANIFISSGDHYAFEKPHSLILDQDREFGTAASQVDGRVFIEDDCWLGWGSVVKRGLWIGKGAVIGANSVVTKNVPPYTIVAGQPAKIIKTRLDFVPPKFVEAKNSLHHPYFYRGFLLSKPERTNALAGEVDVSREAFVTMEKCDWTWCEIKGTVLAQDFAMLVHADRRQTVMQHIAQGPFTLRIARTDFLDMSEIDPDWSPDFNQWCTFKFCSNAPNRNQDGPSLWSIQSFEIA